MKKITGLLSILPWFNKVVGIHVGYSFYLCLFGALGSIGLAIALFVLQSKMPSPEIATSTTPSAHTTVNVTNTSQQMTAMPTLIQPTVSPYHPLQPLPQPMQLGFHPSQPTQTVFNPAQMSQPGFVPSQTTQPGTLASQMIQPGVHHFQPAQLYDPSQQSVIPTQTSLATPNPTLPPPYAVIDTEEGKQEHKMDDGDGLQHKL